MIFFGGVWWVINNSWLDPTDPDSEIFNGNFCHCGKVGNCKNFASNSINNNCSVWGSWAVSADVCCLRVLLASRRNTARLVARSIRVKSLFDLKFFLIFLNSSLASPHQFCYKMPIYSHNRKVVMPLSLQCLLKEVIMWKFCDLEFLNSLFLAS